MSVVCREKEQKRNVMKASCLSLCCLDEVGGGRKAGKQERRKEGKKKRRKAVVGSLGRWVECQEGWLDVCVNERCMDVWMDDRVKKQKENEKKRVKSKAKVKVKVPTLPPPSPSQHKTS